jgi:hypothetical protein
MKCNETLGKWCKNKHGASKIIDTFETYHRPQGRVVVQLDKDQHRKGSASEGLHTYGV